MKKRYMHEEYNKSDRIYKIYEQDNENVNYIFDKYNLLKDKEYTISDKIYNYLLRYNIINKEIIENENNKRQLQKLKTMPYKEYLQTDHWKEIRKRALIRAKYKCQLCSSKDNLNVHHNTYENRGEEKDEDLIVLCHRCHAKFHDKHNEIENNNSNSSNEIDTLIDEISISFKKDNFIREYVNKHKEYLKKLLVDYVETNLKGEVINNLFYKIFPKDKITKNKLDCEDICKVLTTLNFAYRCERGYKYIDNLYIFSNALYNI